MITLFSAVFMREPDIVVIRQAARAVTRALGFDYHEQIRITTGVSELVRAAQGGMGSKAKVTVELVLRRTALPQQLIVEVAGPGLGTRAARPDVDSAIAAEKLLDRFERAHGTPDGTWRLCRALPPRAAWVSDADAAAICAEVVQLRAAPAGGYSEELARQTHELSAALLELERKQQELTKLNAELSDTNRGVMALYAELDERANHLRRADELKTRFFSYVSHEFRTPLNSIVALGKLLLDRTDGDLSMEQETQVRLIHESAAELLDMVSDLLDLAKAEAGKTDLAVTRFSAAMLFGTLRGMIRPLLASSSVALEFGAVGTMPPLLTDEGKLAQILRNFLSNAVKFTDKGAIAVSAEVLRAGDRVPGGDEPVFEESVLFRVTDTGIGIRREDQDSIFDEFAQVRHGLQRKARGTGLGLPLCRRLASLLGGRVWVTSELGSGSTFYCLVPRVHHRADDEIRSTPHVAGATPLLIVSGSADRRDALEEMFAETPFMPVSVSPPELNEDLLATLDATVAVVDSIPGPDTDGDLARPMELLRRAGVPLLTVGGDSGELEHPRDLLQAAYRAVMPEGLRRVLVVDDDERFLRILSKSLEPLCDEVVATGDPRAALATAESGGIDCAVVDLIMPEVDGFTLLAQLRERPVTKSLPVVICSSKTLTDEEQVLVRRMRTAFVSKDDLEAERLRSGLFEARLSAAPLRRPWSPAELGARP